VHHPTSFPRRLYLTVVATRYICSHPSHTEFPTFPTWSALQTHLHTAHPPTCPHEECRGRTFKSTQRLKEHLKVHEEREADVCARAEQAGRVLEGSVEGTRELGEDDRSKALADLVAESWSRKKRRRSSVAVMEGAKSPKLPRLADGEAGKEWSCPEDGCDKQFKTVSRTLFTLTLISSVKSMGSLLS
jgi:hypothetical protein